MVVSINWGPQYKFLVYVHPYYGDPQKRPFNLLSQLNAAHKICVPALRIFAKIQNPKMTACRFFHVYAKIQKSKNASVQPPCNFLPKKIELSQNNLQMFAKKLLSFRTVRIFGLRAHKPIQKSMCFFFEFSRIRPKPNRVNIAHRFAATFNLGKP